MKDCMGVCIHPGDSVAYRLWNDPMQIGEVRRLGTRLVVIWKESTGYVHQLPSRVLVLNARKPPTLEASEPASS